MPRGFNPEYIIWHIGITFTLLFFMRTFLIAILLLAIVNFLSAQVTNENDSSQTLQEVTVKAYEQNRKLLQVPTAIAVVTKTQLMKFNNTNILPALNSNPGIRMEERSPGSYRPNIRGVHCGPHLVYEM